MSVRYVIRLPEIAAWLVLFGVAVYLLSEVWRSQ